MRQRGSAIGQRSRQTVVSPICTADTPPSPQPPLGRFAPSSSSASNRATSHRSARKGQRWPGSSSSSSRHSTYSNLRTRSGQGGRGGEARDGSSVRRRRVRNQAERGDVSEWRRCGCRHAPCHLRTTQPCPQLPRPQPSSPQPSRPRGSMRVPSSTPTRTVQPTPPAGRIADDSSAATAIRSARFSP